MRATASCLHTPSRQCPVSTEHQGRVEALLTPVQRQEDCDGNRENTQQAEFMTTVSKNTSHTRWRK